MTAETIVEAEDSVCTFPGCVHGDEVERDRWGRPVGPFGPGGEKAVAIRMSTMSKAATYSDPSGLMDWAAARAVEGVIRDRGVADAVRVALSQGDEKAVKAEVARASIAGGREVASDRGTALHAAIVADVQGAPLELLDGAMSASVGAAREILADNGLTVILAEQFGVLADGGMIVGGSYDLLVRDRRNRFRVCDVKTSAKLNDRRYPLGVSSQVAGYARMRRWCPRSGWLRDPEIDLEVGLLLSVPIDAGEAYLDRLDLEVGWAGLKLGALVRDWQSSKPLTAGAE